MSLPHPYILSNAGACCEILESLRDTDDFPNTVFLLANTPAE